jgi:hypothetical protein
MSIWDKYRKESKQTIVILSVIVLSVKLCRADGIFTEIERQEILDIVSHEPEERLLLLKIIKEAEVDEGSMIDDAKRIKELLGRENISFYEFIIANLVRLAKVDKMVHEEIKFIQQVGEEFELNKNPVIKFCENLIKNFQKKNLELSNNA